jgi:histone-lysine N-methyltransferase SETMAR
MLPTKEGLQFYVCNELKRGFQPNTIHEHLLGVWKDQTPSLPTIYRWCAKFQQEQCESFEDKAKPGRPSSTKTNENVKKIAELIADNPKQSTRDIEEQTGINHTTVHQILSSELNLRNVCSVWIPHLLSPENQRLRMTSSQQIRHFLDGPHEEVKRCYVTEDETWIEFDPWSTKMENRVWITKDEERPRTVRPQMTHRRALLLVAFTANKKFSVMAIPAGQTINSQVYIDFIKTTANKWRVLRTDPTHLSELTWQHDNARPHCSKETKEYLTNHHVRLLWQAPYSPDINQCDRWLFPALKKQLRAMQFNSADEVEKAALQTLRGIPQDRFLTEIENLRNHCAAIITRGGDYITE